MNHIIGGPVASGKTTKALQWLDEKGGGVFVTRYPQEIKVLIQNLEFKNADKIQIVEVPEARYLAVDDADLDTTALVIRSAKQP